MGRLSRPRRAEPPRGIRLKRKNGSVLLDQGHMMNATGLVGMFAATVIAELREAENSFTELPPRSVTRRPY